MIGEWREGVGDMGRDDGYHMRTVICIFTVVCATWQVGCTNPRIITAANPDRLAATAYPGRAERGDDLDILVIRQGWNIQLINRTPHHYRDVQVWLNQQYVGDMKRIQIGTQNRTALSNFVNQYREPYPVGGILSPGQGYPLVHAELFDPATTKRHRLLVQVNYKPGDVARYD